MQLNFVAGLQAIAALATLSLLPGCAIFAAIHHIWPTPEIVVADRGLREGMLLRMIRAERARGRRRMCSG